MKRILIFAEKSFTLMIETSIGAGPHDRRK